MTVAPASLLRRRGWFTFADDMTARIRPISVATLSAAVAAVALGLAVPQMLLAAPAMPEAERSPDRAVTVARTRNVCFSDTLQVTGVLGPRNEVLVRPDREGLQIAQVQVEPGDTVVAGQILARLVPSDGQGTGQAGPGIPVRAPVAGTVVSSAAVVGAMASGRGPPLFRIAAQGEMELVAETPVATLAGLAPNQAASVEIVGVGSLPGRVRLIANTVNQATQLGQVRVFIGSDARLRAGVSARPDRHRPAMRPRCRCRRCCTARAARWCRSIQDGRIESRRVKVGLMASGQAEIRDGLSEGDMVVARAGAFLREGDRVRPVRRRSLPNSRISRTRRRSGRQMQDGRPGAAFWLLPEPSGSNPRCCAGPTPSASGALPNRSRRARSELRRGGSRGGGLDVREAGHGTGSEGWPGTSGALLMLGP